MPSIASGPASLRADEDWPGRDGQGTLARMESMSTPAPLLRPSRPEEPRATIADWLAEPEERGAELINGRIVYKAMPAPRHGRAQRKIGVATDPYDRHRLENGPGWWISTEVDLKLGEDGVRPDLCGWRRDRYPRMPEPAPALKVVTSPPDWVCEVLSPSTAHRDITEKLAIYHRAEVGHYWIADPATQVLTVYRWHPQGYLLVQAAGGTEPIHPEPFPAIFLVPADLFLLEEPAPSAP